ncbi:hypothetical protein EVAR_23009_1 [Eumeta japonica]|uniref:Uncharacterized protein n=1 Tax=Eumeta variegata TaxID=151549 RepID=A0A4C1URT6_EUMVA|nr:hypothetical protein EVAR_23009_1 [Eumeta japonica]
MRSGIEVRIETGTEIEMRSGIEVRTESGTGIEMRSGIENRNKGGIGIEKDQNEIRISIRVMEGPKSKRKRIERETGQNRNENIKKLKEVAEQEHGMKENPRNEINAVCVSGDDGPRRWRPPA